MKSKNPHHQHAVAKRKPATHVVAPWLFAMMLLAWWLGAYGAVVYGVVTDRGPFAIVLRLENGIFGGSNAILTALLAAFVIFLGPLYAARALHRIRPDSSALADLDLQMANAFRSRAEIIEAGRITWDQSDHDGRIRIARRMRRLGLWMVAISIGAAFVTSIWVRAAADADAGQPLTKVTVPLRKPIEIGNASHWVRIIGARPNFDAMLTRNYTIRGNSYRDYYTALRPPGWHPGDRVYLLERDVTIPGYHDPDDTPDPSGPIEGDLSFGGPRADVAYTYRRHGFGVGPWTAVLRRNLVLHDKIPGEAGGLGYLFWLEGGFFALAGLSIAYRGHRRLQRVLAEQK
jgi:hypothetical protein